jgi:hypothetical protein
MVPATLIFVSVSEEYTPREILWIPELKVHTRKLRCSKNLKSLNDMLCNAVQFVIFKLSIGKIIGMRDDDVSTEDHGNLNDETTGHSNTWIFLHCF